MEREEIVRRLGARDWREVVLAFAGKTPAEVEHRLDKRFPNDDNHSVALAIVEKMTKAEGWYVVENGYMRVTDLSDRQPHEDIVKHFETKAAARKWLRGVPRETHTYTVFYNRGEGRGFISEVSDVVDRIAGPHDTWHGDYLSRDEAQAVLDRLTAGKTPP